MQNRSPWMTTIWLICSAVVIIFIVGAWIRMKDERAGQDLSAAIAANKRPAAPALPTKALKGSDNKGLPRWYKVADNSQISSAKNKIIFVNFWASWCGPCVDEAPVLAKLANEFKQDILFVGVNPSGEDSISDANAFVKRHKITFPIVRASAAEKGAWGVNGFPESFVVGRDAKISAHINGPIDETELRELLRAEIKRKVRVSQRIANERR